MISGPLDRRVAIYRPAASTDDGYTTIPGDEEAFAHRWCKVIHQSGREIVEAGGKDGQRVTRFQFRWDSVTSTLHETDQLEHDGERYAVTGPLIELGRREGVEVIAVTVGVV